jgi:inosose dehydratase
MMIDLIERIAAIADEHGLTPAVHPHAGSYIEFADEIDKLLDDTGMPLCLDTGHAAYAGINPEQAIASYASRLAHVHLKDTDPCVLDRVRLEHLDFWQAISAGVFCPLGTGLVKFPHVVCALRDAGYDGYATIEQDRVPGTGAPLDDLDSSIEVVLRAGINHTDNSACKAVDAAR